MPREGKGQPFGIGDTMKVIATDHPMYGRVFTVWGFTVSKQTISRDSVAAVAALHAAPVYGYWHEFERIAKNKDLHRDADVAEHTDQCYADVAQRDGLEMPAERSAVEGMAIKGAAEKAIWGG